MKPDYKNWVPKNMLYLFAVIALVCYAITCFLHRVLQPGMKKSVLSSLFLIVAVVFTAIFIWMTRMYRAFSYDGNRKLSEEIVEGLAGYIEVPENGLVLDAVTSNYVYHNIRKKKRKCTA
ncbi:MAG TPA: hypothetical protein GX736_01630 [Mogibacterium sp.]|nr:hypothetical protein [Mogibacterium sp.]